MKNTKLNKFVLYDSDDRKPIYYVLLSKDIEESEINNAISRVKENLPGEWCYDDILEELCKLDKDIEFYDLEVTTYITI